MSEAEFLGISQFRSELETQMKSWNSQVSEDKKIKYSSSLKEKIKFVSDVCDGRFLMQKRSLENALKKKNVKNVKETVQDICENFHRFWDEFGSAKFPGMSYKKVSSLCISKEFCWVVFEN